MNLKFVHDSPESYFLTEMLSENNGIDNRGFLVCTNVVAARTGTQMYKGYEIGVIDEALQNETFYLERDPEEVFSEDTLKSFRNAVFTDGHPSEGTVSTKNARYLMKGMVTNPRKADFKDEHGHELLLVDIVVTDDKLIEDIQSGKRQVSAGYSWDYEILSLEDRRLKVKDIRANHLALVEKGRAGSAMILDEDKDFITEIVIDSDITEIEGGELMAKEKDNTVHKFKHKGKIFEVRGVEDKEVAEETVKKFIVENKNQEEE